MNFAIKRKLCKKKERELTVEGFRLFSGILGSKTKR